MSANSKASRSIQVPCSKSILNRILILSALTNSSINIQNAELCDDTTYMIKGLEKLGHKIKYKNNTITFTPGKNPEPAKIFTGNAGTTTRFLTAYSTLLASSITITGDKRMQERPILELVKALKTLGAKITCPTSCPPVKILPSVLQGGNLTLPGNISSQYLSAILMVAPFAQEKVTINIDQKLCSTPYVKLTLSTMKSFNLKVMNKKLKQFIITPQKGKKLKNFTIESDASSGSYPAAFATLNPEREIILENLNKKSLQGDIKFLNYLNVMGAKITQSKNNLKIQGPKKLKSLGKVNMNETPDLVMTFAVLAMFTQGKTKIYDVENLRIKETDRLKALENEIKKFGIKVKTGKDFIEITGNPKLLENKKITQKSIQIKTYDDHRIAMCFGILKNHFPKMVTENPLCVSKSYTSFWCDLKHLTPNNIILIGLRGSGKTTLGKLLAKKLKKKFIDTDEEIEKTSKKKVKDIVDQKGWEYFRNLEKKMIKKISALENTVIATGGGAILDKQNIENLKTNGFIVYLEVSPARAAARIAHDKNRPLLTTQKSLTKELTHLLKERKSIYENTANLIFKRSNNTAKDINNLSTTVKEF